MSTPLEQAAPPRLGDVSFWYAQNGLPQPRRPALIGAAEADICIIGAGFTGLWTAWYLHQAAPELRIAILEKNFAGFGASGRNGGWLTGGFAWSHARYAKSHGKPAVLAMAKALHGAVDEVIAVAEAEGITADILRTDELSLAVNPAQWQRLQAEVTHRQHWGEADRVSLLDAAALAERIKVPGVLGALRVTGVARVQPAKLVRGLAEAVCRRGIRLYEDSPALAIAPGLVRTPQGQLRAPFILRCTEGFTASLPGHRRDWLPLNSAQIVTEPLAPEIWAQIGWQGHELIGDAAHAYCYCQRTAEGRLVVGGRGVPYRFGSRLDQDGRPDPKTVALLQQILHRHFPAAAAARIDHAWCGTLAVPRDWCATVGFDRSSGIGFAGGYVGVGLSTSNLAGRVLCDLALGRQSALTALPLVNRPLRRWEPEPLRWLGVRGMYALLQAADRAEARPGANRSSRLAHLGAKLAGRD